MSCSTIGGFLKASKQLFAADLGTTHLHSIQTDSTKMCISWKCIGLWFYRIKHTEMKIFHQSDVLSWGGCTHWVQILDLVLWDLPSCRTLALLLFLHFFRDFFLFSGGREMSIPQSSVGVMVPFVPSTQIHPKLPLGGTEISPLTSLGVFCCRRRWMAQ